MAIFCLATSVSDLKERLGRIIVGFTYDDEPVTVADLKAQGAAAALLKDAIMPNLVQSLEQSPALVHGGPFANIAHGCNSVMATSLALKLSDYVVTEAGFGADLGAEKFLDIKCRQAGLTPDAVVIVATCRALKHHGGAADYNSENVEALGKGMGNLIKHIETIKNVYQLPTVVAINRFPADTDAEIEYLTEECRKLGVNVELSDVWAKGGDGALELADEVIRLAESGEGDFRFSYEDDLSITDKINAVATKVYGADGADITKAAAKQLARIERLGLGKLPVCIAKTQYSLSDDQTLLGRPENFRITIREFRISAGAGFIVALAGDIMTMPGLPTHPAAENIDVDSHGVISGLF